MADDKKTPVVLNFYKRDILIGVGAHKDARPGEIVSLDILVSEKNEEMDYDYRNNNKEFNPDLRLIFTHPSQIGVIIKGLEEANRAMEDAGDKNLMEELLDIIKDVSVKSKKKDTKNNTVH